MADNEKLVYWVFDVDGTMTNGCVFYDETGNEFKSFNTRDAAGFFALHATGRKIIVLTGRECNATKKRMEELNVDYLFQNIRDKAAFLKLFMIEHKIEKYQLAYVGDDLNDICAMELAGFVACPHDACIEVKQRADFISHTKGGDGVIREIVEYILRAYEQWDEAIFKAYGIRKLS